MKTIKELIYALTAAAKRKKIRRWLGCYDISSNGKILTPTLTMNLVPGL